jgi:hypothetical protein
VFVVIFFRANDFVSPFYLLAVCETKDRKEDDHQEDIYLTSPLVVLRIRVRVENLSHLIIEEICDEEQSVSIDDSTGSVVIVTTHVLGSSSSRSP